MSESPRSAGHARYGWLAGLLVALYLASGLYIVAGNERALVRRCGRAVSPLRASGLHFDLPWPFARVDRVRLHELRTVHVGWTGEDVAIDTRFPTSGAERRSEFLTGDKNVLHMQVDVQYVVADPYAALLRVRRPELRLQLLAESLVTDLVSRSGVDFVHPLGLNELRQELARQLRTAAEGEGLGLSVEDVTIHSVLPPVEVKAAFLDVSNARAEREREIQASHTRGEQQLAASQDSALKLREEAQTDRHTRVQAAHGAAERFVRVVEQLEREAESPAGESSGDRYRLARTRQMQRSYLSAMQEILPQLARKVFLEAEGPGDLLLAPGRE